MSPERPLLRPFALATLLLFFALLRFLGFLQPHYLSMDETVYSTLGYQLRHYPTNYSTAAIYSIIESHGSRAMEYLNRPLFKHPPVYPLVLALSYLVLGGHIFAALLPTLLAWMGICILAYKIGTRIFGPAVGLLALVSCLIDPMGWALSLKIYPECVLTFLCLLGLWLYLKNYQNGSLVLSGAVLGLACLVKYQASLYLLAMLLHLGVLRCTKKMFSLSVPFLLVLSPWIAAQLAVYGGDLWKRLHADFFIAHDFAWQIAILSILCCGLLQPILAYLKKKGLTNRPWIMTSIRWALCAVLASPLIFFSNRLPALFLWNSLPMTTYLRDFPQESGFYFIQPLLFFPFLILLPFSPLLTISSTKRSEIFLLLTLMPLFFLVASLWENPQIRYVYPVVPVLLILAAATGHWIWGLLSNIVLPWQKIGRLAFTLLMLFFLAKTLRNDWFFGFINEIGKF